MPPIAILLVRVCVCVLLQQLITVVIIMYYIGLALHLVLITSFRSLCDILYIDPRWQVVLLIVGFPSSVLSFLRSGHRSCTTLLSYCHPHDWYHGPYRSKGRLDSLDPDMYMYRVGVCVQCTNIILTLGLSVHLTQWQFWWCNAQAVGKYFPI